MFFDVPGWEVGQTVVESKKKKLSKAEVQEKQALMQQQQQKKRKSIEEENKWKKKDVQKPKIVVPTKTISNNNISGGGGGGVVKKSKEESKLSGARFRYLNQKLYESSSRDALQYFRTNPEDFEHYHSGFREQTKAWPVNPIDVFINKLAEFGERKFTVVADIGCGDAKIAMQFVGDDKVKVHSFDLVAVNEHVTVANMTKLPLEDSSVDIAIFSLSLMNTDYERALTEAHRIIKPKGELWIAEVASRLDTSGGMEAFERSLQEVGFKVVDGDESNKVFFLLFATKYKAQPFLKSKGKNFKNSNITIAPVLKPCLYKKR